MSSITSKKNILTLFALLSCTACIHDESLKTIAASLVGKQIGMNSNPMSSDKVRHISETPIAGNFRRSYRCEIKSISPSIIGPQCTITLETDASQTIRSVRLFGDVDHCAACSDVFVSVYTRRGSR